jgi:hypothetical protein
MDIKAGATVGFATALGGLGGVMLAAFMGSLLDRKSGEMMVGVGAAGALVGAFVGGTIVAPTPAAAPLAGVPPTPVELQPGSTSSTKEGLLFAHDGPIPTPLELQPGSTTSSK